MKKQLPCTLCTSCQYGGYEITRVNVGKCGNISDGTGAKCMGLLVSAINIGDWKECNLCNGEGERDGMKCRPCRGQGWIATRRF